jgi:cell division transport system permease protein
MFSNRFLIKTMQMVGATRGFITKPLLTRALLNGLISSFIAIFLLFGLIQWASTLLPQIKILQGLKSSILLFGGMIVIGLSISVLSTYRSVLKYLKMKIEDLY